MIERSLRLGDGSFSPWVSGVLISPAVAVNLASADEFNGRQKRENTSVPNAHTASILGHLPRAPGLTLTASMSLFRAGTAYSSFPNGWASLWTRALPASLGTFPLWAGGFLASCQLQSLSGLWTILLAEPAFGITALLPQNAPPPLAGAAPSRLLPLLGSAQKPWSYPLLLHLLYKVWQMKVGQRD